MAIVLDITASLDGYVAGPNPSLEDPLGENGMRLHDWVFPLRTWRAQHGMDGGEANDDDARVARGLANLRATVMGRKMFSGGSGPWEDDPNAGGWWGDEPPFQHPVFVVTHHAREPLTFANGTTFHFVDGIDPAVASAREAAGDGDVRVSGGAAIAREALDAGFLDRIELHVAPILLGGGTRLFDGAQFRQLELIEAASSPRVAHLSFRPI